MIEDVDFRHLYAEFGRRIGLPNLALDAYGDACLDIDGLRLHILHMAEIEEVQLSVAAARLPATPQPALLTWLLTESREQIEKRGVAFAVEPEDNSALLLRRLSTRGLTLERFSREVETLVSLAESAAREIAARGAAAVDRGSDKPDEIAWLRRV